MVAPIDYRTNIGNPLQAAMQNYQQGLAISDYARKRESEELAKTRNLAMRDELAKLSLNQNATADDYINFSVKYPEMSKKFKNIIEQKTEEQKQTSIRQLSHIYSALSSGQIDIAKQLLAEEKQAAENAGMTDDAKKAGVMLNQIEMNPTAAKTSVALALSSIVGSDKFAETFKALKPAQYRMLSEAEKIERNLDPKKPYQVSPEGKISSVTDKGLSITLNQGEKLVGPNKDQILTKDEAGNYIIKPVKGGKTWRDLQEQEKKEQEATEKKTKTEALKTRASNVVIKDIGRLKTKIENAPWYSPIAGTISSKIFPGLRQNRVDAEQLKKTIVANIGFDRLQQMREASPTGGALGAISDRELSTLQAVLGSLELTQSEKQLIKNLTRLETAYNDVMKKASAYPNADQFGFTGSETEQPTEDLIRAVGRTRDGRIKLSDGRVVSKTEAMKILGMNK